MPRRNRSELDWENLVKDYDAHYSNKSKSWYCRERSLSASSFCKWYLKYGNKQSSGNFVKVVVSKPVKIKKHFYVKFFGLRLIKLELLSV